MSKVLCVGIAVADVVTSTVKKTPEVGKLELMDSITMHSGGCAVNTAIDLKKIGEDSGVICLLGNDGMGRFVFEQLKEQKVDVRGVRFTDRECTSASVVLVNEHGERSFLHTLGTNKLLSIEHIDWDIVEMSEYVFVAGALLMQKFDGAETAEFLRRVKEMGKFTILDTAWDSEGKWMKALAPSMPHIDLFIPSLEEAEMLSGASDVRRMAEIFMGLGAKNVVIKMGAEGCYVRSGEYEGFLGGYSVPVVDTNGAGDSFVAGFITGLANGLTLRECGIFANAVGAHCVMGKGASSGIKSKEEIFKFIRERESENGAL